MKLSLALILLYKIRVNSVSPEELYSKAIYETEKS